MEDIIKLRSRYGAINYLKKMPKPDGTGDFVEGYGWTITFE